MILLLNVIIQEFSLPYIIQFYNILYILCHMQWIKHFGVSKFYLKKLILLFIKVAKMYQK